MLHLWALRFRARPGAACERVVGTGGGLRHEMKDKSKFSLGQLLPAWAVALSLASSAATARRKLKLAVGGCGVALFLASSAMAGSFDGIKTVFVVVMENHDWVTIKGSDYCPYINKTLLPMASYAENYTTPPGLHPSEPNYIWMEAGTNFGIFDDKGVGANHLKATNHLVSLLLRAGISWKSYQENISGTDCPAHDNFPYTSRHNPFVFFDDVVADDNYCITHIRPFYELSADLKANTVARYNFITPNLTNIMHDLVPGSPSSRLQGDNWLAKEIPTILASAAYQEGGVIFIVWDEGSDETNDGPIGLIVLSPLAKGNGYSNQIHYTHSSLLRTLEEIFQVRPFLRDAANAKDLSDLFRTVRFSSADLTGDAEAVLVLSGVPVGKSLVLESSIDLNAWRAVQTNSSSTGNLIFRQPTGTDAVSTFFRVRQLP